MAYNSEQGIHDLGIQPETSPLLSQRMERIYARHTEVLDHLPGVDSLMDDIREFALTHPDESILIYCIGPSAAGKRATAGNIIAKFLYGKKEKDIEFRQRIKKKGRRLQPHYLEFPAFLRQQDMQLEDMNLPHSTWGRHSIEEYSQAARSMRNALWLATDHLPQEDPTGLHLFVVKAPATIFLGLQPHPFILSQGSFAIALRPDRLFQTPEVEAREKIWRGADYEETEQLYKGRGITMDGFPDPQQFSYEVGNLAVWQRVEEVIIKGALQEKRSGNLPDCPPFTAEEYARNSSLAQDVQYHYFNLKLQRWGFDTLRFRLPVNRRLDIEQIYYFRELTREHMLPFEQVRLWINAMR